MAEGEVHVLRDDSGTGSPCLFRYLKLLLRLPAEQPQSCRSGELRPWEGRQPRAGLRLLRLPGL